jgi:hypothetical protein
MDKAPAAVQGQLRILDRSGDTKVAWDSSKPDEVKGARDAFNHYKQQGYSIFGATAAGEKGRRLDEFDPQVGIMYVVPRTVGG